MAKESKQLKGRWVWLGAAVILVLVFLSVRSLTRERLQVRVMQATLGSLSSTTSANGRVEPESPHEIFSPLSTTVKTVEVQTGDQVTAGTVLLTLDDIQARARVASAESGVKSAQAALDAVTHNGSLAERQTSAADVSRAQLEHDQAQRDLDALAKLQAAGAASASEVAAARQRLQSATATLEASQTGAKGHYSAVDLERAQAALADAEAGLTAARDVENRTTVRAPANGTVYTLPVRATDFIEEGKLLLEMADLRSERVRAYFDEPEIGALAVGQQATIRWDAKPDRTWHGHIERVPVTVTAYTTRNVGEVLIQIDGGSDDLLPDTNVTIKVTTSSEANALTVPREALHVENGKPFVFRVDGEQLRRTYVTYGTMNLNQVAILSGLNAGDWVATGSISGQPLQEGMPIRLVK
ncbi:MAG TPA: HlyD family efflux transporter periplasmic adaptor subunit [Terracidiphilus sp.]|jgi:HlyD family secretion protein